MQGLHKITYSIQFSDILSAEENGLPYLGGMEERPARDGAHLPARTSVSVVNACQYGGMCPGFMEEDLSRGAARVRQHLWQHHHSNFFYDSQGRYICQWPANDGKTCLEPILDMDNLARYIASVHLQSTTQRCPICGGTFARMDSF